MMHNDNIRRCSANQREDDIVATGLWTEPLNSIIHELQARYCTRYVSLCCLLKSLFRQSCIARHYHLRRCSSEMQRMLCSTKFVHRTWNMVDVKRGRLCTCLIRPGSSPFSPRFATGSPRSKQPLQTCSFSIFSTPSLDKTRNRRTRIVIASYRMRILERNLEPRFDTMPAPVCDESVGGVNASRFIQYHPWSRRFLGMPRAC